jgi:ParB-like nuclease domain
MNDLKVCSWPIDRPIPYARNSRKIPERAIEKVAASIKEFGWRVPIVVDKDGVVICGHTRLLAAKKLGLEHVPVHVADNLTLAQVKAYRLMDNRSHEETNWDLELLGPELQELRGLDFDLTLTGFDQHEIDDFLCDPDADDRANIAPPLPEYPVARSGDVWIMGKHRIICGDCTHANVVAQLLSHVMPHLMVADPPYGISLDSEWRDRAGLNGCGPAKASYTKHRTEACAPTHSRYVTNTPRFERRISPFPGSSSNSIIGRTILFDSRTRCVGRPG